MRQIPWLAAFFAVQQIVRRAQPPDYVVNWSLVGWLCLMGGVAFIVANWRIMSKMFNAFIDWRTPPSGSGYQGGNPRKRDRLDEILDYYGVTDMERTFGVEWENNYLTYILDNRGKLRVKMKWTGKTYEVDE
jgi:hypothetical protein